MTKKEYACWKTHPIQALLERYFRGPPPTVWGGSGPQDCQMTSVFTHEDAQIEHVLDIGSVHVFRFEQMMAWMMQFEDGQFALMVPDDMLEDLSKAHVGELLRHCTYLFDETDDDSRAIYQQEFTHAED